ncbi:hypothetical protein Tco_0617717, partial [Tanacetum coccineum]
LFDSMLVPHQAPEGEGSKQPTEPQLTPSPTYPSIRDQHSKTSSSSSHDTTQYSRDSLEGTNGSARDQAQPSHDSLLSGGPTSDRAEGGITLEELSILCTNLSNRVLALKASKDAQAAEIIKLKTRIKKLKKKRRKNGKPKPEPTLDAFDDLDADGMDYMETKDVLKEGRQSNETEEFNKGSDVDPARQEDSAVEPRTPPTTTSIFDDEDITLAQTLIKMKEEKAKEKGVSIKDVEDSSRPARSTLTLKPLLKIDPKDKCKSILEEPEPAMKMTRSDFDAAQIARDAEIARQLQLDLQAEVERERQREEEASKAAIAEMYDEVQAGIDVDALFAAKLQHEEREEYTIKERAKFLAETIAAQRKFKAAQRSAEIRSMYERQKKPVQDFVPIGSAKEEELIKKMNEKATGEDTSNNEKVLDEPDSTKVEIKQIGHEDNFDLEEEEQLKAFLMIVPNEEGIIDYEVLEKRFPVINWESKFYEFDRHGAECIYYRIFRSDGSSRWIKTFSEMVTRFDRLDLEELYNLVMKRFETTTLEGVDLVLWGDLRTMFNANAEDELWQNQERWNLKSWDLYENCGVHTLILEDGTEIHMLAERKYPLTKETLERMLSLRLVAGTASEDAYTLLRFIQKQIDEYGSHDGGEKDL